MTDSVAPAAAQPLHYAVLVPIGDLAPLVGWNTIYANGDLANARAKAEEWAMANPGQQAVVVQYHDHVQIVPQAKWAKL